MQDKTDLRWQFSERLGYSTIKASNNAADDYVILDKITRFRQGIQMSFSEIAPTFGKVLGS